MFINGENNFFIKYIYDYGGVWRCSNHRETEIIGTQYFSNEGDVKRFVTLLNAYGMMMDEFRRMVTSSDERK